MTSRETTGAAGRVLLCVGFAVVAISTSARGAEPAAQPAKPAGAPAATQQHFKSPEAAASALLAAVKKGDSTQLLTVLGSDAKPIIDSGDAVADREMMERFAASYDEAHTLKSMNASRTQLVVGKDEWPFPIPIAKEKTGWRFDTAAGQEEILDRRVGRNELFTIQTCLAIVDAQRDYYARNPNRDSLHHYARRFNSSEGKRDGLYFKTKADEEESPLGELVAQARDEGYKGKDQQDKDKPNPYHGYQYRMLEAQGPNARDGAYDYIAKEQMIGGFAVVAYPAIYDNSGVMTFIVNQDGLVYQKDLGKDTANLARAITQFDPDKSWERVPEKEQAPAAISTADSE
jgi:Protein of unknown function (DUF2950)